MPLETLGAPLPEAENQDTKKIAASSALETENYVSFQGIDILMAGTWNAITGKSTITKADLAQAVIASKELPEVPLKFGHDSPLGGAAPAIGFVTNLKLADKGNTLKGDLVDVPQWLAKDLHKTYPQRSIEAIRNWETNKKVYPFALTGLALLGQEWPAVTDLDSLRKLITQEG